MQRLTAGSYPVTTSGAVMSRRLGSADYTLSEGMLIEGTKHEAYACFCSEGHVGDRRFSSEQRAAFVCGLRSVAQLQSSYSPFPFPSPHVL
jgi:hypothetical protein